MQSIVKKADEYCNKINYHPRYHYQKLEKYLIDNHNLDYSAFGHVVGNEKNITLFLLSL